MSRISRYQTAPLQNEKKKQPIPGIAETGPSPIPANPPPDSHDVPWRRSTPIETGETTIGLSGGQPNSDRSARSNSPWFHYGCSIPEEMDRWKRKVWLGCDFGGAWAILEEF
ncbi:hypothetical protein Ddye_019380 [Dipteronia dyeriana]|uniref:Uncharacterized protein n=1 Tax=Dipteronia dyeriana TaxID=168575 RepID=A0AAD9TYN7_9ROSI|nr:hypothetical protein Ddye_019380 [Dipteronia dyeriana]